jgi:Family of unknown function (DUF5715)
MTLSEEVPVSLSRRDVFKKAWAFVFVWSLTTNISNVLAQSPWKLNGKKTDALIDFLDQIEKKLQANIPEWTNFPKERYFAIAPDTGEVWIEDVHIYRGTADNKIIKIPDKNGALIFPRAESISGSGVGERIRLNDDRYILLAIATPISSEKLPENERSKSPFTYVTAVPPNRAFQTPEIQARWLRYLQDVITGAFATNIKNEYMESSMSDENLEKEMDPRLVQLFAIVEHMDISVLAHANDKGKLDEEYNRVLTNYTLNRNLAYRYGKSSANARGMMQITDTTFKLFRDKYEDVDFWEDHTECTTDAKKSILLATILIDENIKNLIRSKWSNITLESYRSWRVSGWKSSHLPRALWVLYNAGHKSKKYILPIDKINSRFLPIETQIYLKKIDYVWDKINSTSAVPVLKDSHTTRKPKIERPKIPVSETSIRSTIRGAKFRLVFEKSRARSIGERARTYHDVSLQIRAKKLVKIDPNNNLHIDGGIGKEWKANSAEKELLHYLTPVAKYNLLFIAQTFYKKFNKPLRVTSMNRNEEYVKKLRETNPNATSPSSHEFGTTFDISHKDMTPLEKTFIEWHLLAWQKEWKMIVIKEVKNACYHIFSERKIA